MIYQNEDLDKAAREMLTNQSPGLGVRADGDPVMTTPITAIATPEAIMLTTAALNAMAAAMNMSRAMAR
ncbi:hypothetical protein ACIFOC_00849 [Leucobacter aridicollis]|uniref:hypothetical protein n=1 Tax=Leucobacter aridicollis TaxID=283878 RepID=UPI0021676B83|nr:hypothetical protein [Leucobacter aridicollis]MCS3427180.1 hypothetical protein [Leucobacter aridicollis]